MPPRSPLVDEPSAPEVPSQSSQTGADRRDSARSLESSTHEAGRSSASLPTVPSADRAAELASADLRPDEHTLTDVVDRRRAGAAAPVDGPPVAPPVTPPVTPAVAVVVGGGAVVGSPVVGVTIADLVDRRSAVATLSADVSGEGLATPVVKYRTLGTLGSGGMGDVFEVEDVDLCRTVALKRVRRAQLSQTSIALFLQEAQVTAQLEHPNIVPVHDLGRLVTGEPYFTMKKATTTTLKDVFAQLRQGDPQAQDRYGLRRLLVLFLAVTRAVGHAHARRVVHCDLKPANVLLGQHGEVLVGDWGLAMPDPRRPFDADAVPVTFPPQSVTGRILRSGSLPWMSPEQAVGGDIDRRSDIWTLGMILYEVLTLEPALAARTPSEVAVRAHAIVPPRARAPSRDIDGEIEAICLRCLQVEPAQRFDHGLALADALESFLTGARRREQARAAHDDGEAAFDRWQALRVERATLLERQKQLSARIRPWDAAPQKQPLWDIEERLFRLEVEVEDALAAALDGWGRASGLDPEFHPAQDRLADAHLALFLDAEARGRRLDEAFHRRQVTRFHRGRHDNVLSGRGRVTLRPFAASTGSTANSTGSTERRNLDVDIAASVFVEHARQLVPEPLPLPDRDAVTDLELAMGSVLFVVTSPGKRPARVPVQVGRGVHVALDVALYDEADVGDDWVVVPRGPFISGGDEQALNSEPRSVRTLDDFFIARFPVTCAQYARFLNLVARDGAHLAARHAPRTRPVEAAEGGRLWEPDHTGRWVLPKVDADGNPVFPDAPVMGVSFFDAQMYCRVMSVADGVTVRLPTEHEWEKAARGADGRFFPWGNGFDPGFCKMALSRPGRPQPEPVGSFPVDESVYGVRDVAGGIREWCDSVYDEAGETRTLRGGAWYFNAAYCRLAFRHGYLPHIVFTNFGFRLARDPPRR